MILLIGDGPVSRQALAELLRTSGHEVFEAENAKQGLDLLGTHAVAFVITTIALPDRNGFKLIGLIRQRKPLMPIILLSSYLSQQTGDALLNSTGTRMKYFRKPVVPSELEATIKKLLDSPT